MVKIVFIHPDLGIGGAERSMIDAALSLKSKGHAVEFVTTHHDPSHCFQETKDGTLKVTSVGDWFPRNIFGKCYALCAYIRMIFAAVYLVVFSDIQFDVIFCDQISACIPVLKLSSAKVLFFCHFPDMLLTQRKTFMKKLYRAPIDWLEEKTTGMAHCILVNSKFTAGVFKETFTSLATTEPEVLYPIPAFSALDQSAETPTSDIFPLNKSTVFLSINRFERKKNLALAIKALAFLKDSMGETLEDVHLVMAGGYDDRVVENKEYFEELKDLADKLKISQYITFVRSFSDAQKRTLLNYSTCLLYTPDREHFGIVPVEAMYLKCPVIAVKSGGPLETVEDNVTGYLCQPEEDSFAKAMQKFLDNRQLKKTMGEAGRKRVQEKFSFDTFTKQLSGLVVKLAKEKTASTFTHAIFLAFVIITVIGIVSVIIYSNL